MIERPRFFVWVRNNSPEFAKYNYHSPQRWHEVPMMVNLRPTWPEGTEVPLSEEEMNLSLNELAEKYRTRIPGLHKLEMI